MVKVKICGNTNLDDTMAAVQAGADAVGFVFYKKSPRAVEPKMAAEIISRLPPFVVPVGVFVNEELGTVRRILKDCNIPLAQLHGDESPQYCAELGRSVIKAIRVRDRGDLERMTSYQVAGFVLDALVEGVPGGTGVTIDWDLAGEAQVVGPIILAGGLTPDNVLEAVRQARPYGVDVSSGVEASPGRKDHAKVQAFIANAKSWTW
ncbi:MAG TPA: phosphoribosylanthranilate isomerase [Nitrospirales bacterium]